MLTVVPSTIGRISADALAAHIRPVRPLATRNLVDFVQEHNPRVLNPLYRQPRHLVHVDQSALFLLDQVLERLRHLHLALLGPLPEQPRQHVLQVHVHVVGRLRGQKFKTRLIAIANINLHHPLIQLAFAELLPQLLPALFVPASLVALLGPPQVPRVLLQFIPELPEQRERVGRRSGKPSQHLIPIQSADLSRRRLHHIRAQRHLPVGRHHAGSPRRTHSTVVDRTRLLPLPNPEDAQSHRQRFQPYFVSERSARRVVQCRFHEQLPAYRHSITASSKGRHPNAVRSRCPNLPTRTQCG